MMKKEDSPQLELFSQSEDSHGLKPPSINNSLLSRIWNYEKTILTIIGIVITSIISYSLGIEKGKSLTMAKSNFQIDIAPPPRIQQPIEIPAIKEPDSAPAIIKKEERRFIIQLASYKSKSLAQKELDLLKKKGFAPLILSKGSYSVLCVGNFSNKEGAKSMMPELKKRYNDCYIRRL
jgi:cell division protein FtsN